MEVVATAKWVRTTARKARLVAATVQGLPVSEALTILSFTPRAAAIEVAKVIRSAAANAEHNYNLDGADLRVARVEIDGAAIIKRFRPRAQGRAFSIFKRTTHLRAVVTDEGRPIPRARRRIVTGAETSPAPRRDRSAAPARGVTRGARPASRAKPATAPGQVDDVETKVDTAPSPAKARSSTRRQAATARGAAAADSTTKAAKPRTAKRPADTDSDEAEE
jgi:large subunit ribosomal protein L22